MLHLKGLVTVLYWDLVVELRRREAVLGMALFAVLVLFIASYGLSGRMELAAEVGPLIFWIAVLFAGTVGLSRAFSAEREGGALTGVLLSPLDAGAYYVAKVAATWLYVMSMGALLEGAYAVVFNFTRPEGLVWLFLAMGAFSFAYVAAGAVMAAMTSSLRGGEVVLRITLFPLMVPAVITALSMSEGIFSPEGRPAPRAFLSLIALGVVYLSAGFLLFPKVVEE